MKYNITLFLGLLLGAFSCDTVEYFPEKSPVLEGRFRGAGTEKRTLDNGSVIDVQWPIVLRVVTFEPLAIGADGQATANYYAIDSFEVLGDFTVLDPKERISDNRTFKFTHNSISRQVVLEGEFDPNGERVKGIFLIKDLLFGERSGTFLLERNN